jgi:hypothetical protein
MACETGQPVAQLKQCQQRLIFVPERSLIWAVSCRSGVGTHTGHSNSKGAFSHRFIIGFHHVDYANKTGNGFSGG